jgi:sarcosine oxidase
VDDTHVVVIGGGVAGAAKAWALAGRGVPVTLLERFEFGHLRGSSGGPTRIFRFAYSKERYARMAGPACETWRALEAASGESLLATTGGLDIGEHAAVVAGNLDTIGREFSWHDAAEARVRWPGIRFADDERMLFQPDAGVCYSDRTVHALARLAASRGAIIREHAVASRIQTEGDGVRVRLDDGAGIRADVAVVAAGSWAGPLLADAGLDVPRTPTLEQVSYLRLEQPFVLPTLIDWIEHRPASEGFQMRGPYAVPDPEVPGEVKVGLHLSGPAVNPNDGPFAVDQERVDEVLAWAARRFGSFEQTRPPHTCLYTRTPDHDFVIDRVGPIVIGSACSGHGFKFGPLVGELLADLATGTEPAVDIADFSARRWPDLFASP